MSMPRDLGNTVLIHSPPQRQARTPSIGKVHTSTPEDVAVQLDPFDLSGIQHPDTHKRRSKQSRMSLDSLLEMDPLFDPDDSFDRFDYLNMDMDDDHDDDSLGGDVLSTGNSPFLKDRNPLLSPTMIDLTESGNDGSRDNLSSPISSSRRQSVSLLLAPPSPHPLTDDLDSNQSIYYTSLSNPSDMSALLSGELALERRSKSLAKQLKREKRRELEEKRDKKRKRSLSMREEATGSSNSVADSSLTTLSRYYNPHLDRKCRICHSFGHTASECTYDVDYFQCAVCGLPGHACSGQCPERYCYKCFVKHPVSEACLPQNRLGVGSSRENYEGLMVNPLCGLCGSTSHSTPHCDWDPTSSDTQTVLAHIKCYVCGAYGHLSCTPQSNTTTTGKYKQTMDGLEEADTPYHRACLNCGSGSHLVDECIYVVKFNIFKFDKDKETSRVLKGRGACLECGRMGHQVDACPSRQCFLCKKTGHSRNNCPYVTRKSDRKHMARQTRSYNSEQHDDHSRKRRDTHTPSKDRRNSSGQYRHGGDGGDHDDDEHGSSRPIKRQKYRHDDQHNTHRTSQYSGGRFRSKRDAIASSQGYDPTDPTPKKPRKEKKAKKDKFKQKQKSKQKNDGMQSPSAKRKSPKKSKHA